MNSKVLHDKIKEIEDHKVEVEMRLLRKNDKNYGQQEDQGKSTICSSDTTVSLKHYDQVSAKL
jgi:hypothetical protein